MGYYCSLFLRVLRLDVHTKLRIELIPPPQHTHTQLGAAFVEGLGATISPGGHRAAASMSSLTGTTALTPAKLRATSTTVRIKKKK